MTEFQYYGLIATMFFCVAFRDHKFILALLMLLNWILHVAASDIGKAFIKGLMGE